MHITDLSHFLDAKGAIGPKSGPARRFAEFLASVVATASAKGPRAVSGAAQCRCNKCKGLIATKVAPDDAVEWRCASCGQQGRITNWRRSFWDLSAPR